MPVRHAEAALSLASIGKTDRLADELRGRPQQLGEIEPHVRARALPAVVGRDDHVESARRKSLHDADDMIWIGLRLCGRSGKAKRNQAVISVITVISVVGVAAVLAALAIQLSQEGVTPESVVLMLTLMGLICGLLQVGFGTVGLGRLIKYVPYPVVSGYLSGVGLIIILSQVPKFLGLPKQTHLWEGLSSPSLWQWQGVAVGAVTVAVMVTEAPTA